MCTSSSFTQKTSFSRTGNLANGGTLFFVFCWNPSSFLPCLLPSFLACAVVLMLHIYAPPPSLPPLLPPSAPSLPSYLLSFLTPVPERNRRGGDGQTVGFITSATQSTAPPTAELTERALVRERVLGRRLRALPTMAKRVFCESRFTMGPAAAATTCKKQRRPLARNS
jgi:hypothetical protein